MIFTTIRGRKIDILHRNKISRRVKYKVSGSYKKGAELTQIIYLGIINISKALSTMSARTIVFSFARTKIQWFARIQTMVRADIVEGALVANPTRFYSPLSIT